MNRIVFILLLFFSPFFLNAQTLPVWYKVHGQDPKKINFTGYVSANVPFSMLKVVDTVSIPEVTSVFLIDREGKFFQELPVDTAAYCSNKDQVIVGKKKNGRMLKGVMTLKGEPVLPVEYTALRFYNSLFAVRNQEALWALYDHKGNRLTAFWYKDMSFTPFGKVKVRDSQGTGILNEDGTWCVENKYGEIEQLTVDTFLLQEPDRWQYLDRTKTSKFIWTADSVKALNDSLFLYYAEGRVWIKDSSGAIAGSGKGYPAIEKRTDRILQVTSGKYVGLMELSGKEIIPVKYYTIVLEATGHIKALGDEVKVLRYGDVVNKNKKRWSLYNAKGEKVLNRQYKEIRSFQEGMIALQNDENLWGFADERGAIVLEPQYQYASDFRNGYALVKYPGAEENDYQLINKKGTTVFVGKEAQLFYLGVIRYRKCEDSLRQEGEPDTELHYGVPPYRYDCYSPSEYGYIRVRNGSYTGVLHPTGFEVVQAYQDTVYLASADTFFLYKRNNGMLGYSDRYGNTALYLTDRFEGVQPLKEGYSKFKKDGLYGFIDMYGNTHIAPKYSACEDFQNGMAAVFLKGKWGFIDKEENLLVQPYYKEVRPFRNGFAPVKNIKNKWVFIDKAGQLVSTSMYDDFREIKNGKYIVLKNTRWGINDSNGKEILSPKYEYIEEIGPDLLKVKKDGKFGVMDFQENIILYYQYDEVLYNLYTDTFFVKINGRSRKSTRPIR